MTDYGDKLLDLTREHGVINGLEKAIKRSNEMAEALRQIARATEPGEEPFIDVINRIAVDALGDLR